MTDVYATGDMASSDLIGQYRAPWPPLDAQSITDMTLNIQKSEQSNIELICAAYMGDKVTVSKLLEDDKTDPNISDNNNNTALLAATMQSHVEIVHKLLDSGASVKNKAEELSPLLVAVTTARSRIVPVLVQKGEANLYTRDNQGRTAIVLAALRGDYRMVKCLHKLGTDVNRRNDAGLTVLMAAVQGGSLKVIDYLVTAGAAVDEAANSGLTSVLCSACQRETGALEYLLKYTKNVDWADERGNTALILATMTRNTQAIAHLLKSSAEVDTVNQDGFSALHYAKEVPEIKSMLTNHEDLHIYNETSQKHSISTSSTDTSVENSNELENYNQKQDSRDSSIFENVLNKRLKAVEMLVRSDEAAVNKQNEEGQTPLVLAVINTDLPMVKLLHHHGADVNMEDKQGQTAAFYAMDSIDVLSWLLKCKAHVDHKALGGKTLLMEACGVGNKEAICVLMKHRASLDIEDDSGMTALMYCCLPTCLTPVETMPLLVDEGASVNVTDHSGNTALSLALTSQNFDLAKYILGHERTDRGNIIIEAFHQGKASVLEFIVSSLKRVRLHTLQTALQYFLGNLELDMLGLLASVGRYTLLTLTRDPSFYKDCFALALACMSLVDSHALDETDNIVQVLQLVIDHVFDRNGFGRQLLCESLRDGMYHCAKMLVEKGRGGSSSTQLDSNICYVIDEEEMTVGPMENPEHELDVLKDVLATMDGLISVKKRELKAIRENSKTFKGNLECREASVLQLEHQMKELLSNGPFLQDPSDGFQTTSPKSEEVSDQAKSLKHDKVDETQTLHNGPNQEEEVPSDEELEVIKTPGVQRDLAQYTPSRPAHHSDDKPASSPFMLLFNFPQNTASGSMVRQDPRLVATTWLNHKPHPKLYLFKLHQSISQYTIDGSKEASNACAIIAMLFAYEFIKHPTPMRETPLISDIPEDVFEQIEKAIREGNEMHRINYQGKPTYLGPEEVRMLVTHLDVKLVKEVDVDTRELHTLVPHVMDLKQNQVLLFIKNYRVVSVFPCNETRWLLLFDSHLHVIHETGVTKKFGSFLFYCKKEVKVVEQLFQRYDQMVDPVPFYGKFALFEI